MILRIMQNLIQKKKIKYLKKYKYMQTDYEFLYKLIINHDLNDNTIKEVNILNQMLGKIEEIKDNKVSQKKEKNKLVKY